VGQEQEEGEGLGEEGDVGEEGGGGNGRRFSGKVHYLRFFCVLIHFTVSIKTNVFQNVLHTSIFNQFVETDFVDVSGFT
jgi:hypothetical protein